MNYAFMIGRLGRDPELRYVDSRGDGSRAVCNFSLAVDSGFGEHKKVTWFNVSAWGKTGEAAAQWLKKGSQCAVVGRIELREYQNKDGVTKQSLDLVANEVRFLDSKSDRDGDERQTQRPTGRPPGPTPSNKDDGDVPFSPSRF